MAGPKPGDAPIYFRTGKRGKLAVLALGAVWSMVSLGLAPPAPAAGCGTELAAAIPPRSSSALGGSEFASTIAGLDGEVREAAILREVTVGNVPPFQRQLVPVKLDASAPGGAASSAVICVMPDYLAIGSDEDYFLVPMRLGTALSIARRFGFLLPTRRMVDAIYAQSPLHLQPQPLPAGDTMRSTAYYAQHNQLVREQRAGSGVPLGTLTAGDKKDLVLSNRLWAMPDRVAIYGWHLPAGRPIQPLSTVHGWHYADYSHGVRLVSSTVYVDGSALRIEDLLSQARYATLLSDEGPIPDVARLIDLLTLRKVNSP